MNRSPPRTRAVTARATHPKNLVRRSHHALQVRWAHAAVPGAAKLGHTVWTGADDDRLGGSTPMWWSHEDTSCRRFAGAGRG